MDSDVPAAPVVTDPDMQERAERWASTMRGHRVDGIALAHADSYAGAGTRATVTRAEREERDDRWLAPAATRASGAGERRLAEAPDANRTCFERDRDRIYHASSFRRLAGKTQVFLFPEDHQRTRLTHALEVAQIARSVATALGLNVALTEAIAIGHDCGHGPGGHASEDALSPYLVDGFDHAVWGADVTLQPLNLCRETLDGIRNHSWSRPAPSTPEGEVVSWADRIAYVCHDFEDAVATGVVRPDDLPEIVAARVGTDRSRQLGTFVQAMIDATALTGRIGMVDDIAEALAAFRRFNYDRIYLRPESAQQAHSVIGMLRSLVDFLLEHPSLVGDDEADRVVGLDDGGRTDETSATDGADEPQVVKTVAYVGGMTDRYACRQAIELLGWELQRLPMTMWAEPM